MKQISEIQDSNRSEANECKATKHTLTTFKFNANKKHIKTVVFNEKNAVYLKYLS